MVLGIEDEDAIVAVDGHAPRPGQLPRLASRAAPAAQRPPVGGELLHALVALLDHVQFALAVERQVVRVRQLTGTVAGLAPDAHQVAVAVEDLDAVVAGVGAVQQAVGADDHGPQPGELGGARSWSAPALDEMTVAVELADALVLAELGDVVEAVGVLDDVADVAELSGSGAAVAAEL